MPDQPLRPGSREAQQVSDGNWAAYYMLTGKDQMALVIEQDSPDGKTVVSVPLTATGTRAAQVAAGDAGSGRRTSDVQCDAAAAGVTNDGEIRCAAGLPVSADDGRGPRFEKLRRLLNA